MNMKEEYNYLKEIREKMENPSEQMLKDYYNARNFIGLEALKLENKKVFFDGKCDFYDPIKHNKDTLKELEKKLNEKGYLMASEIGWPVYPTTWECGLDIFDPDYEVIKVLDDGTILIDYKEVH